MVEWESMVCWRVCERVRREELRVRIWKASLVDWVFSEEISWVVREREEDFWSSFCCMSD